MADEISSMRKTNENTRWISKEMDFLQTTPRLPGCLVNNFTKFTTLHKYLETTYNDNIIIFKKVTCHKPQLEHLCSHLSNQLPGGQRGTTVSPSRVVVLCKTFNISMSS
jgi:hypothetical protein